MSKRDWYEVIEAIAYYKGLMGTKLREMDGLILLEFHLDESMGGYQRVVFQMEQVKYKGTY